MCETYALYKKDFKFITEHQRIYDKDQFTKLLDKGDPHSNEHPLPRCSPEIINRFVESLEMKNGILKTVFYGDIKDVLTFTEFFTLFERLGIPIAQFTDMMDWLCFPPCGRSNNNVCNPDNCH